MKTPLLCRLAATLPLAALLFGAAPSRAQTAPGASNPLRSYAEWAQLPASIQRGCAAHPTAVLALSESPALVIRSDLSMRQVQIASQKPGVKRVDLGPYQLALGFYDAVHKVGADSEVADFEREDGSHVVCLEQFNARVASSPQIVIARELTLGSCPRRDVLGHEMVHYQIDQAVLAQLRLEAPAIASGFSGVYVGATLQDAMDKVNAANKLFAAVLARRLSDLRTPRHAAHDSPEEYARESRSCGGQTRAVAFAAMGLDEYGRPAAAAPAAPQLARDR